MTDIVVSVRISGWCCLCGSSFGCWAAHVIIWQRRWLGIGQPDHCEVRTPGEAWLRCVDAKSSRVGNAIQRSLLQRCCNHTTEDSVWSVQRTDRLISLEESGLLVMLSGGIGIEVNGHFQSNSNSEVALRFVYSIPWWSSCCKTKVFCSTYSFLTVALMFWAKHLLSDVFWLKGYTADIGGCDD